MAVEFDYTSMVGDQPTHQTLLSGFVMNKDSLKAINNSIGTKMSDRGMLTGRSLTGSDMQDPKTGKVPLLVTDIFEENREHFQSHHVPEEWARWAIKCMIHSKKHNFHKTKKGMQVKREQTPQQDPKTPTFTTPGSQAPSETSSQPRSIGSKRDLEDAFDESPFKRVKLIGSDPTTDETRTWLVECNRVERPEIDPTFFDLREMIEPDQNGKYFAAGFRNASFSLFQTFLKDSPIAFNEKNDNIRGWVPNLGRFSLVFSAISWRGCLTTQAKHDVEATLKFEVNNIKQSPPATPPPPLSQTSVQHGLAQPNPPQLDVNMDTEGEYLLQTTESQPWSPPRLETPEKAPPRPPLPLASRPKPQPTVAEELKSGGAAEPSGPGSGKEPSSSEPAPEEPVPFPELGTEESKEPVPFPELGTEEEDELSDDDDEDDGGVPDDDFAENHIDTLLESAANNPVCEHIKRPEIKDACVVFLHDEKNLKSKDRVKLEGMKHGLYVFQMFGLYLLLLISNGDVNGLILADEMGFGKTVLALAWFVTQRWLVLMFDDVANARARKQWHKHLAPSTTHQPQASDARCPSQSKWPIVCCCVERHITSRWKPQRGLTLGIVPPRLVLNWKKEWDEHVDINHPKLKPKLKILHTTARGPNMLSTAEVSELMVEPGGLPTLDASSYCLITTSQSWGSIEKEFKVTRRWTTPREGFKRATDPHISHTWYLYVGAQFIDEVHEQKGRATIAMTKMREITETNNECKSLFMSGTPWTSSPKELAGILSVLEPKANETRLGTRSWANHERLHHAQTKEFQKLCQRYERLANLEEGTADIIEANAITTTVAKILEATMVRRTSDTPWFDGPIVDVPHNEVDVRTVNFPDRYKPLLEEVHTVVAEQIAREDRLWAERYGATRKPPTTNRWFRTSWKERAIATIPAFAALLQAHKDIDFTWKQYCKEGYLNSVDSPYHRRLTHFIRNNPKFNEVDKEIRNLGDMDIVEVDGEGTKVRDEHGDLKIIRGPEKLVVLSNNPVVSACLAKMIAREHPQHTVAFVHGKMNQAQRMQTVLEFQEAAGYRVVTPPTIIVGPLGILGTGHTLNRSRKIIIMDPDFDSKKEEQGIKRISRIGTINETRAIILEDRDVPVEWMIKEKQKRRKILAQKTMRTAREAEKADRELEELAKKSAEENDTAMAV